MTSLPKARLLVVTVALGLGIALAGCAPEAPTSTPTPTAAQTSASPRATPAPEETTGATQEPETPVAFTDRELLQICIDATKAQFDPDVVFDDRSARIEKRTVSPEWLVLIPVQTNGYAGEGACTIGGSPADPDIGMASASIQRMSEEQIQKIIRGEDADPEG